MIIQQSLGVLFIYHHYIILVTCLISPCRKARGRDYSDEFIADFILV
jgi:hypothetical protein